MNRILAALLALLVVGYSPAYAAIAAGAIWEVRPSTGSDTNGGAFVQGVTGISSKTDLAVSAGSAVQVSSASYGFTSADIGRWLKVTAGTGYTTGFYQVTAVAAGIATLNYSPAAVSSTGGSFTIYYGLDYSQQGSANSGGSNQSTTDLVTNATTTVTSATAAFTADVVGNVVYIAGGTGSVVGAWYEITAYTNATTVTVDRATGLTAGTGATLRIGGALQTLTTVATSMVAQNAVWIKNEAAISTTTGFTLAIGGVFSGYSSTRGDGGQVTIQDSATASIALVTLSAGGMLFENFNINCGSNAGTTGIFATGAITEIWFNKVQNCASYGIRYNNNNQMVNVQGNEVTGDLTGSSGGIVDSAGIMFAVSNYVHDGVAPGIVGPFLAQNNIVYNRTGATSDGISCTFACSMFSNIVYTTGRDGVRMTNFDYSYIAQNNIIAKAGAYGFNISGITKTAMLDGNAYFSNTTANISGPLTSGYLAGYPYTNSHDVLLSVDPFVNAAGGNFALNTTGGGGGALRQTGIPSSWPGLGSTTSYPDFGAVQAQSSAGGAGGSFVFGQ